MTTPQTACQPSEAGKARLHEGAPPKVMQGMVGISKGLTDTRSLTVDGANWVVCVPRSL